ncbi:Protein C26B9.1 b [Aphelenchoides avenae]|nr:Protein C26B9.1 b [Aphelenchus avenae]
MALRQTVKDANRKTLEHNLLVGVQDRGHLSCHKMAILFIFYEAAGCVDDIERLLRVQNASDSRANPKTDAQLKEAARELLLDHTQAYVKAYMKKQLLFPTRPSEGVSDFRPKHCKGSYCLCQFVEMRHFNNTKHVWYEHLIA